jgi:hypothetical protein
MEPRDNDLFFILPAAWAGLTPGLPFLFDYPRDTSPVPPFLFLNRASAERIWNSSAKMFLPTMASKPFELPQRPPRKIPVHIVRHGTKCRRNS